MTGGRPRRQRDMRSVKVAALLRCRPRRWGRVENHFGPWRNLDNGHDVSHRNAAARAGGRSPMVRMTPPQAGQGLISLVAVFCVAERGA